MTLSCIAGHWVQSPPTCSISYPGPFPRADCSHLKLSAVPQNLPDDLYNLDLSYNNILTITNMSFAAYGKLQVLILQWNALTQIEGNSFEHLLDLRVVYMNCNNIGRLPDALFHNNLHLSILELSHNRLTDIPNNALGLAWFQNRLHTTHVNTSPLNETLCSQSSFKELVNQPLEAFHPGDFCGFNAPLISGLISGSVIVTLLGLLIYRKRWWLNYKIFLLKLFVLGYKQQEEDLQANDYEYGLNIMYHDDDDDWVHGVLRPALEERMPHLQRVAYGDEALRVSMYYIDAVHHIIETSYKTVFLISNHCVDDAWFITKVRVALEHVNETGLDKVILVFLEDIPDERLPYLVRLFLSRNRPNLVWTEDHDGQDLFWAYFEKSMQTNPQINHVFPI
ncbi:toll-like receptor 3 [Diadema antillarum]|uniref:toll-like receptor 3 n=1 Tax=Diadema antillarum TaxID=105358 RepID=UPI003A883D4F